MDIDLTGVLNDFEAKIPPNYGGEGNPSGSTLYRWGVARQPFVFNLNGSLLDVSDAAHCSADGFIKNPINHNWNRVCGCDIDVVLGFNSFMQIRPNYSLVGNVHKTRFDMGDCKLTMANINITPIARPKVDQRIDQALVELNSKIDQYNFRDRVAPFWSTLFKPIALDDLGYLSINPTQVYMAQPTGTDHTLKTVVGISAKPTFTLTNPGDGPAVTPPVPDILPAVGTDFNIYADAHLEYEPLNDLLRRNLVEKRIPTGKKGVLKIKDVGISGVGNNHLLVNLKFKGRYGWVHYKGNLYFTCIPNIDNQSNQFYVSEILFDAGTEDELKKKAATWILNKLITELLKNEIHFNLTDQLNDVRQKVASSLNRELANNVKMACSISKFQPDGILPLSEFLLVRAAASGNVSLSIQTKE